MSAVPEPRPAKPERTPTLEDLDRRHLVHAFTQLPVDAGGGPVVMVEGRGAVVRDAAGREYIDGVGGLWLANLGYSRPELAEAAASQMRRLSYWSTFWGFSNEPAVRLAARIASLTPGDLNRVFFTSGGSEGNETSIKLARLYHRVRGKPQKTVVIALDRAYHGVSYGALTATGLPSVRSGYDPLTGDFVHIRTPYPFRCPHGPDCKDCGASAADELERTIREIGPDRVAAFIAEPVLGVGGVIVPPPSFFPRVREICDRYDVLWIADEVITGFGRTGRWFGVEHWGVVPDLMTIAKGVTSGYLPLGASILSDRVYGELEAAGAMVNHGFTYSGHPVACAVALENLRLLEAEGWIPRVAALGERLRRALRELDHPHIGEVRGLGLMVAVELVQDRETRRPPEVEGASFRVQQLCRQRGVIVRGVAPGTVVTLSPPFVITEEQMDRIVSTLAAAIDEVFGRG